MKQSICIYCADIGSVASNSFAWASHPQRATSIQWGDMRSLAVAVAEDLDRGAPVALGFEAPLFVPLADEPAELTRGRVGERNRAWSAGAGCGALATALVQVVWILRAVRERAPAHRAFLNWEDFRASCSGLFIWEAFVTGATKGDDHQDDASISVKAFRAASRHSRLESCITPSSNTYSLAGAALLRSGWSTDLNLLSTPCTVIRPPDRRR